MFGLQLLSKQSSALDKPAAGSAVRPFCAGPFSLLKGRCTTQAEQMPESSSDGKSSTTTQLSWCLDLIQEALASIASSKTQRTHNLQRPQNSFGGSSKHNTMGKRLQQHN